MGYRVPSTKLAVKVAACATICDLSDPGASYFFSVFEKHALTAERYRLYAGGIEAIRTTGLPFDPRQTHAISQPVEAVQSIGKIIYGVI